MGALRYFGVLFLLVSFNSTAGHAAPEQVGDAALPQGLEGLWFGSGQLELSGSGDEELANARDRRYRRDRYRRDYRKDRRDRRDEVYRDRTARLEVAFYGSTKSHKWYLIVQEVRDILDDSFHVRMDDRALRSSQYKMEWGFDVRWYGPKRYLWRAIDRIENIDEVIYVKHKRYHF